MKFETLEFRDFGPMRSAKVEFTGNLIGIVGPNGVGKSTLIEGMHAALTGTFRRHASIVGAVRDVPGGKSANGSVRAVFVHGDVRAKVRRTIMASGSAASGFSGSQRATLQLESLSGEKIDEVSGVTPVNDRIASLLGIDPFVLSNYVFIEQDRTTSVVSADRSTRAKAMQRLFGLDRFERVWDLLGERVRGIPDIHSTDDVASLRRELHDVDNEIRDTTARLGRANAELASLDVDAAQRDLDLASKMKTSAARLASAETRVDAERNQVTIAGNRREQAKAAADALRSKSESMQETANAAGAFLEQYNGLRAKLARMEALSERFKAVQRQLESLRAPTPPGETWSDDDERALVKTSGELDVSVGIVNRYAALQVSGGVVANCPTCGQPVADVAAEISKHKAIAAALRPQLDEMSCRKSRILEGAARFRSAVAVYESQLRNARDESTAIGMEQEQLRSSMPDPSLFTDEHRAAATKTVSEYTVVLAETRSALNLELESLRALQDAERALQTALAALDREREEIRQLGIEQERLTTDHLRRCELVVSQAMQWRVEAARMSERVEFLKRTSSSLNARLIRASHVHEIAERNRRAKALLVDARNVFHRDCLPQKLAHGFVGSINGSLDKALTAIRSDFSARVVLDADGYRFSCLFDDGCERDGCELSGGEKTRLSIAMILAVNELMASRVGVLCMDEPTDQLDDDNIQALADVFSNVRQYASNTGAQIVVVTHAASLLGAFDQVVRIGKGNVQ